MKSDVLPEPSEDGDQLLTADEAGRVLGVHRTTMYRWADCGFIPVVHVPRPSRPPGSTALVRRFRRRDMEEVALSMDRMADAAEAS